MMHRIPELLKRNSLIGAAIVGPDGKFWDVNETLCEILGYQRETLLRLTFQQISHPEDLTPQVNPFRSVINGELKSFTLKKRYKHGQTAEWISCTLHCEGFHSESGEFLYFFSQVSKLGDKELTEVETQRLSEIKYAINNNGFALHYQPIVDLRSDETVGYEALSRWAKDNELIFPGDFLPLLRKANSEHLLCYWVIEKTQADSSKIGQWISFNISPFTLARADWHDQKLPARGHMEILETEAVSEEIQSRIQSARGKGVKIALDDFGTGYCSYDRLLKGQVDLVKLDRSIISGLPARESRVMVDAIVALSQKLSIKVIAEGVETQQQADMLKAIGCDMAQGYLFGRPAPLPAITRSSSGAIH